MNEQLDLFKDILTEVTKVTKKKAKPKGSVLSSKAYSLLEFKRILNKEAPKKLIKTNKEFKNKFIPLQVVEQMLMAIYDAYEITMPHQPVLMEGQIITTVTITVHHPILKIPLSYSGVSCVPLIAAENTNMKWNHRNIPGGKAFAILNASKEIGQIFRAEKDDHSDVMRDYFEKKKEVTKEDEAESHIKTRLLKMINAAKTITSLRKLEKQIATIKDKEVAEVYMNKEINLQKTK
tara:strand:+ start:75 stop:779 length:705 start_codon:yes stop_codon:yes gene_type:complete